MFHKVTLEIARNAHLCVPVSGKDVSIFSNQLISILIVCDTNWRYALLYIILLSLISPIWKVTYPNIRF